MNRKLLVALCVAGLLRAVAAQTPAPAIERGDLERTIEVENAEREYLLHVPESYDGKQVVPLVIVLHGRTRDGRDAARMYGMSELSDRKGFLVAYPTALGQPTTWNPGYFTGDRKNDLLFLRELIERIERDYEVDPRRIFVAGHSSGGIMSYAMAGQHADKVAAVGVVAGSIGIELGGRTVKISAPKEPVSVIHFHGMKDRTLPYDDEHGGGSRYDFFLSAPESVAFWVEADQCANEPEREELKGGKILVDRWSGGERGTEVAPSTVTPGGDLVSRPSVSHLVTWSLDTTPHTRGRRDCSS